VSRLATGHKLLAKYMNQIADGFLLLFRGGKELLHTKGAGSLMLIPVIINIIIFSALVFVLIYFVLPWTIGWTDSIRFGVILAWIIRLAILMLVFVAYAFLFPMIAEILGAPFYEAIGGRIDEAHDQAIVERPWYIEVKLALSQESRKLAVLIVMSIVILILQFAPVIGQILSATLGFAALVITLGADSVGPPLARRGLMLGDRRKWVIGNIKPVIGIGLGKSLGLMIPIFNVVVLPMAAAGGTLLVQKYDKK
jgi:uncharacterized protein involved in cysteine biosynthesis